jgi:hypothetical protein
MRMWRLGGLLGVAVPALAAFGGCDCDQRKAVSSSGKQPGVENLREGWRVVGQVTDSEGHPMPGVEVLAHCGEGTLRVTGRATTNEQGAYDLRFGPGILMMNPDDPVSIQAATISPHKPGYFEENLHRQGDLYMAYRPPQPEDWPGWLRPEHSDQPFEPDCFVLPGQPRSVDFVMVPAAQVRGRLLDGAGQPVTQTYVSLSGDELPPSSSAVASVKTDEDGAFTLAEVPTKSYWFSVRNARGQETRTETFAFARPGPYTVELVQDTSAARLELRVLSRP